MKILYCGDQGIKNGLAISILSLIKHATTPLNIYIMTINYQDSKPITDKTISLLDNLVKVCYNDILPLKSSKELQNFISNPKNHKNPKNFVKKIDATEIFKKNLPTKNMETVFTKYYFKPAAMLRLYADKIPELPDKYLYLDYDVLCLNDPTEFYNTDLKNVEVAGVLDIYGKNFYHYNFPKLRQGFFKNLKNYHKDYMNSGVLLINMPECKKSNLFPRAVKLCSTKHMMLADQAALNKVIKKRKLMPRKYNEQQDHPKKDTVFHHFSNNFKFWPYFHVQKIKPYEIDKIHEVLKITGYDDILKIYQKIKETL